MAGRKVDGLKKLGDKIKVVSGSINKLLGPSYLIQGISNMQNLIGNLNKPPGTTVQVPSVQQHHPL